MKDFIYLSVGFARLGSVLCGTAWLRFAKVAQAESPVELLFFWWMTSRKATRLWKLAAVPLCQSINQPTRSSRLTCFSLSELFDTEKITFIAFLRVFYCYFTVLYLLEFGTWDTQSAAGKHVEAFGETWLGIYEISSTLKVIWIGVKNGK